MAAREVGMGQLARWEVGSSRGGWWAAHEVDAGGENVSTASQLSARHVKTPSEARQIRRFEASR